MPPRLDVDIPLDQQAPRRARRAVETLGEAIDPAVQPDVVLLVSELISNSVKHSGTGGDVRLQIEAPAPTRLRVEVVDHGSGFEPKERDRPNTEPGGWGLHLVETLTDRWGVDNGSTHVWFEIDR